MRSRSVCFPARRPIRLGAPSDSAPSIGSNASSSGSAGYSLLLMEAVSTTRPESPLAQLLRSRELHPGLNAVIAAPDAEMRRLVAELESDPAVVLPASLGPAGLALAIRAVLATSQATAPQQRPGVEAGSAGPRPPGELAANA